MLGITVSIFGARKKEPLPKVLTIAILYVLGICVTYTALGVVAALTGGLFGSALQSVWVNLVLGGLMLVLSLGMFGLYEMQPPSWVMDRLGGAQGTKLARPVRGWASASSPRRAWVRSWSPSWP